MAGYLAGDVDEWIYIDVADQHEDSIRFIKDCEKAIGKEIQILRSSQYATVEDCVRAFGGFKNAHNGFAPCTNWLKKRVRKEWENKHTDYDLIYVWGMDGNERHRAENLRESMLDMEHEFPLIDNNLTKEDVHGLFERTFNFKRPKMYDMGYPNNNCIGCVKGGMGYWNKIRRDFPDVFESRARLEREVGMTMLKDKNGYIYLDELNENRGDMNTEVMADCGVFCYLAEINMRKEE